MKTPKRHSDTPDLIDKRDCARWKRKNRVKQLKRTISRLENTIVQLEKEKENAYHKGHAAGYDAGFARLMF